MPGIRAVGRWQLRFLSIWLKSPGRIELRSTEHSDVNLALFAKHLCQSVVGKIYKPDVPPLAISGIASLL